MLVGYFQMYGDILEGVIISDKLTNRFRQGRRHARNQVRTSLDFSHHSSSQCHYQINNNITSLPTGKTKSTAQISIITTQLIQNSSKNSNTTSIFFWVRWKLQVDLIWWTIFLALKNIKKTNRRVNNFRFRSQNYITDCWGLQILIDFVDFIFTRFARGKKKENCFCVWLMNWKGGILLYVVEDKRDWLGWLMMKKMDWIVVVVDDNDDKEWVLMKWVKKKSLEVMGLNILL